MGSDTHVHLQWDVLEGALVKTETDTVFSVTARADALTGTQIV